MGSNDRKRDADGGIDPLEGELRAEVDEGIARYLAEGGVSASPRDKPCGLPKDQRPTIEGPNNAGAAVIEGRG